MRLNLVFGAVLVAASVAVAEVKVTPVRLEEKRISQLVKERVSYSGQEGIELSLQLAGPEAEKANRYGKVKITEAIDDKGTDLKPQEDRFGKTDEFREFDNAFFRKPERGAKMEPPKIKIDLGKPARAAAKIMIVKGEFQLMDTGALRSVQVSNLPGLKGKELSDPALQEAGVKITVKEATLGDVDVTLVLSGNTSALQEVNIMKGEEKVSNGASGWRMGGGPEQKTINLSEPLTADMALVLKLTTGKDTITVPFELKDIQLP